MINNFSLLNVYKKMSTKSKVSTQLIYGETFKIIKKKFGWYKIKNEIDNYTGYIKIRNYEKKTKNTHKVSVLIANLYQKPFKKNKIKKKLSFNSVLTVVQKKNNFYKFKKYWIKKEDVCLIKYKKKDIFNGIEKFKGVKYKWGGKHFSGIDCSGLVQIFLNFNCRYCPRDSKDQINYFKKNIKLKNIKKNDLIFWKGHVAIALSKRKLIHAYGPYKKVVIMPINRTISLIKRTANLEVIGIKSIS